MLRGPHPDLAKYGDPELATRKTSKLKVKAKRFDRSFLTTFREIRGHYLWGTLNHLREAQTKTSKSINAISICSSIVNTSEFNTHVELSLFISTCLVSLHPEGSAPSHRKTQVGII